MRFLIDAQLSPRLVDWLRQKGHDAEHVLTALGESAHDAAIARRAEADSAIVISKDADFVALLDGRARLLWVRIGNASNRVLLAAFERDWSRIEAELTRNESVVELN